jgi:DNA uptake protein ComE-like DNA-binding protein
MRQALKGLAPSAPDVSAWLWWKSGSEQKPFPAEQATRPLADAPPAPGPPAADETLHQLEERLDEAQIKIREAELRAAAAEEQLRAHEEAEQALREKLLEVERNDSHSEPPAADTTSASAAANGAADEPGGGEVLLNDASFEQLRALGLSVSQAARLIAQRDQRGGFSAPDELDGLYGMPGDLIATLKLHV